jgi:hypothetical protein
MIPAQAILEQLVPLPEQRWADDKIAVEFPG